MAKDSEKEEEQSFNLRLKLEKSANYTKVIVSENQPAPPYWKSRGSVQVNKMILKLKKQCAEFYFHRLKQQAQEKIESNIIWAEHLKDKPVLLKRFYQIQQQSKENQTESSLGFISAIQRVMLLEGKISKYKNSNYEKRKKTRKATIIDLGKNNFNETNTCFFTLTFDPKQYKAKNLENCKKLFRNFTLRLGKQYGNVKYIATFAKQKNGNWHFHMMVNICTMSKKDLKKIWKYGLVDIKQLKTKVYVQNICSYLIKNMNENEDAYMGKKAYLCSKNLNRTQILSSSRKQQEEDCFQEFEELKDKNKFLTYSKEKPVGKMAKLCYPDNKTSEILLSEEELQRDLGSIELLETVFMKTEVVIVPNENKKDCFTQAVKLK